MPQAVNLANETTSLTLVPVARGAASRAALGLQWLLFRRSNQPNREQYTVKNLAETAEPL